MLYVFQSTRPRGARRYVMASSGSGSSFNPRARVGRDDRMLHRRRVFGVSIHAPAWGATQHCQDDEGWQDVADRQGIGRDQSRQEMEAVIKVSIHTLALGARDSTHVV